MSKIEQSPFKNYSRSAWILGTIAASLFVIGFWYWEHWAPDDYSEESLSKGPNYETLNISGVIKSSNRKGWWDMIEADNGTTYYLSSSFPFRNALSSYDATAPENLNHWENHRHYRVLIAGAKVRTQRGSPVIFEVSKVALESKIEPAP